MLHLISEHVDVDPNDNNTNNYQSAAVIAMGLIAFGEEVGMDMSKWIVNHMF